MSIMGKDDLVYANQWNTSAEYFYDKKYYSWMANKLKAGGR